MEGGGKGSPPSPPPGGISGGAGVGGGGRPNMGSVASSIVEGFGAEGGGSWLPLASDLQLYIS